MTESPFAPARCYLLGSRVDHDLDQRYPVLIALTGSCAVPRSSVSLCHKLWSTVLAGCCEPLLHLGTSQRYLRRSVLGSLDPYHGGWQGALTRFFPCHIGLPQKSTGSAEPRHSAQRLQSGEVFRGCSHSIIFRPPSLLPPRSFPPLSIRYVACSGRPWRFTSEHSAVCRLPAHRIC